MQLFHGSDMVIPNPKILTPNRALDFGEGFYTTLNEVQARDFARKVMARNGAECGIVNVYEADVEVMRSELRCLWFDAPSEEWLDFVSDNRSGRVSCEYDFVYGPVANDDVFRTFIAYSAGILSRAETIERLKIKKLYNQLTFSSERSLGYLLFKSSYVI